MSEKDQEQTGGQSVTVTEREIEEPARFRVLMHNDDFTSMDFVVGILHRVFNKDMEEARAIMLLVHNTGLAECGVYTREIAETKVGRVRHDARLAGFPLQCTMEKV